LDAPGNYRYGIEKPPLGDRQLRLPERLQRFSNPAIPKLRRSRVPFPAERPKVLRLPRERKMTIAIQLEAGMGSLVTAADTQESYGAQIVNSGKIVGLWRGNARPLGAINITGAGDSQYIDALSQEIISWFEDFDGTQDELKLQLRSLVRRFYRTYVYPFVGRLDDENIPDYVLLVAYRHQREGGLLRVRGKLVTDSRPFGCTGLGRPVAETLLNRLYPEYPSLDSIAALAAYVIHRVKSSMEGCGLNTEIRFIFQEQIAVVPTNLIEQWEVLFRRYDKLERDLFFNCINFVINPSIPSQFVDRIPQMGPQMRLPDKIVEEINEMRQQFSSLRIFTPPAPQKSEPTQ
jgi:hypothetical protein